LKQAPNDAEDKSERINEVREIQRPYEMQTNLIVVAYVEDSSQDDSDDRKLR
jgi:hypothetical protein